MSVPQREIAELSNHELANEAKDARHRFRELIAAPDPGTELGRKLHLEALARHRGFAETAQKELKARETRRAITALRAEQRERWMWSEQHRTDEEPAVKAATAWSRGGLPDPLAGAELDPSVLSKREGKELFELTLKAFKGGGVAPETKERQRLDALLEKLAGAPAGVMEAARKPAPPRPLPEMRVESVAMPSYLLAWRLGYPEREEFRDDRLGLLWRVLAGLQNRQPVLLGSRIEESDDGTVYLVLQRDGLELGIREWVDQGLLELSRTEAGERRIGLGEKAKQPTESR